MKYELTSAQQTLRRVTRRLCIEVPSALSEAELTDLDEVVKAAPRWPRVALDSAVRQLFGGRAFWDECPHTKEAA